MDFELEQAKRLASPLLIGIAGVTGGGKTIGGLLLASGLTGGEDIALIDTENGRGSMYADEPIIQRALPKGFKRINFQPDHSPERYIKAIKACEAAGIKAAVIDSFSHEWEGTGGCAEIAEKTKRGKQEANWAKAKLEHKRLMNYCLTSSMHLIFCLRARDKVKIEGDKFVSIGIQPIAEKSLMFEMTLSLMLDDESTNFYKRVKSPKALRDHFPGGELLTPDHGRKLKEWNQTGAAVDATQHLITRSQAEAEAGLESYKAWFSSLTPAQKKTLEPVHEDNKKTAKAVEEDLMRQAVEEAKGAE